MSKVHCFTVRLPTELYVDIYELATASNMTMNAKVTELLKVAITKQVDMRELIERMLNKEFGPRAEFETTE